MPKEKTQEAAQSQPMDIDVRIYKNNTPGNIRADASVTLGGCFAIRGVKVMDGSNGLYVAMPSYYVKSSQEYKEYCFPVTKEFRAQLYSAVLDAYEQAMATTQENAPLTQAEPDQSAGMGAMQM